MLGNNGKGWLQSRHGMSRSLRRPFLICPPLKSSLSATMFFRFMAILGKFVKEVPGVRPVWLLWQEAKCRKVMTFWWYAGNRIETATL